MKRTKKRRRVLKKSNHRRRRKYEHRGKEEKKRRTCASRPRNDSQTGCNLTEEKNVQTDEQDRGPRESKRDTREELNRRGPAKSSREGVRRDIPPPCMPQSLGVIPRKKRIRSTT